MKQTADMLRTFGRRRLAILFSVITGLMVSLTGAPAPAADLALPTDAKILEALKAKRLTRCPHTRLRCGGARLRNPPQKGGVAMRQSLLMMAPPPFRARVISFTDRFGDPVPFAQVGSGTAATGGRTLPMPADRELRQGLDNDRSRLARALPRLAGAVDELRTVAATLGAGAPSGGGRLDSTSSALS